MRTAFSNLTCLFEKFIKITKNKKFLLAFLFILSYQLPNVTHDTLTAFISLSHNPSQNHNPTNNTTTSIICIIHLARSASTAHNSRQKAQLASPLLTRFPSSRVIARKTLKSRVCARAYLAAVTIERKGRRRGTQSRVVGSAKKTDSRARAALFMPLQPLWIYRSPSIRIREWVAAGDFRWCCHKGRNRCNGDVGGGVYGI